MDFIFMLTRRDRTIDDAEDLVDAVAELGVRHIGFKDVGVPGAVQERLVARIRARGATSYLEVVSTSPASIASSLAAGAALGVDREPPRPDRLGRPDAVVAVDVEHLAARRGAAGAALGVDRILGGTDLAAAERALGGLDRYFPFPGRPVGHPTRLEGSAVDVERDARQARAGGCGGVDLLAYRATDADPLALVRAARRGVGERLLIVAGSVQSASQVHALAAAGADAFTVGSAVFDGTFSPTKGSLRGQILGILDACHSAPEMAG